MIVVREKFMCFSSYNVSPSFLQFGFCFSSFNLFLVFCSFFDSTGRLSFKEWCKNCSIQIVLVIVKTITRTFCWISNAERTGYSLCPGRLWRWRMTERKNAVLFFSWVQNFGAFARALRSFHWNRTCSVIFVKLCLLIVYIIGTKLK